MLSSFLDSNTENVKHHSLDVFKQNPSGSFYHVGSEDQNPLVFPTRPLGVAEEVGVIVCHIFQTLKRQT